MYEDEGAGFSAEECRRFVAAAEVLGLAQVADEQYRVTDVDATRNLFVPLVGARFREAWAFAMLVVLYPGMTLTLHIDRVFERWRRHLVLQTNPDAWVYHDRVWQHLEAGHVYRMDPMRPHGAVNWGSVPRIHLLVDVDNDGSTHQRL